MPSTKSSSSPVPAEGTGVVDLRSVYDRCFMDGEYNNEPATQRYGFARNALLTWDARSVADVGTGRANFFSRLPSQMHKYSLDLRNYHNIPGIGHYDYDIRTPWNYTRVFEAVTCLDTLEHLPENTIPAAIKNLRYLSHHVVICVSNHSDKHRDVELHLTQRPYHWWRSKMDKCFDVTFSDHIAHDNGNKSYFFKCGPKK